MDSPTKREAAILRLLSEQTAIPLDQLARFCDLQMPKMQKVVQGLVDRGWAVVEQILTDQPAWVWLTSRGAALSDTGLPVLRPSLRQLKHLRTINEARLQVTKADPDGRWVSERRLRSEWQARLTSRIPDAVFETHDEHGGPERHAIEVELSRKPVDYLRNVIAEHSVRYDLVVYLCSTGVARFMERLQLRQDFPTLIVREITDGHRPMRPESSCSASPTSLKKPHRQEDLSQEEISALAFIAEQGAMPLDQLARFLACDSTRAGELASKFVEAGLAKRARPLAQEPDWIWLGTRGTRWSGTGLSAPNPKASALPKFRALNEVRLRQIAEMPEARWISGRVLRQQAGKTGSRPAAVVELDGERHVIEIRLSRGRRAVLEAQIECRLAEYDLVVFYCASRPYALVTYVQEQRCWPGLVVRRIPDPIDAHSRDNLYPVDLDLMVERIAGAIRDDRLARTRARSLVGYLLLGEAGVPQGGRRTVSTLKAECKDLGLVSRQFRGTLSSQLVLPKRIAVARMIRTLRAAVETRELSSSRARLLAGFLFLSTSDVPQSSTRTFWQLRRECKDWNLQWPLF